MSQSAVPSLPSYASTSGGRSGGSGGNTDGVKGGKAGDPDFARMISRPHPTFTRNDLRYRWLLDSYIGGETYINGCYGVDRDMLPVRNLVRHKRETVDAQKNPQMGLYGAMPGYTPASMLGGAEYAVGMGPLGMMGPWPGMLGADPHATAHDDDYEYRRACTPPPAFVEEAVGIHLSKVYDQEVKREGPADLEEWWKDVDGRGTPMDDWMRETVAPLMLVLGVLDVCLDHPKAPPGEVIETRADELRLGLDSCVASYILPQNMIWWRLDSAGRYRECLVREFVDPSDRDDSAIDGTRRQDSPEKAKKAIEAWQRNYVRFRYWSAKESVLLNHSGTEVLERVPHSYGMVPIARLVDQENPHQPHAGKSRYESTARLMRSYYNKDSELILNDTLQAHPFLSGPEDFAKADNTISVGPQYILIKKKNPENGTYEGWEFVAPPKDPAESIRKNLDRIADRIDRINCLTKPAGATGTDGGTVSQSGVSKSMDHHTGNKLLRNLSQALAKNERKVAEMACMVLRNTPLPQIADEIRDQVKVVYPDRFELRGSTELLADAIQFQTFLSMAGNAPMVEAGAAKAVVRDLLADLSDEEYDVFDTEIDEYMSSASTLKEQYREMTAAGIADASNVEGSGSSEQAAEGDPMGQSARTAVSGTQEYGM